MLLDQKDYDELRAVGNLTMDGLRRRARECVNDDKERVKRLKLYNRGGLIALVFDSYLGNKYGEPKRKPNPGEPVFKLGEPLIATKGWFEDEPESPWGSMFDADAGPRRVYKTGEFKGHIESRVRRNYVFVHEDGKEEMIEKFHGFRRPDV